MYLVVADASPIRYLVLIGADQYLERLYGRIMVPDTVAQELLADRTPDKVRNWMQYPPLWVQFVPVTPAIQSNVIALLSKRANMMSCCWHCSFNPIWS
jgi:predicted nucleic acid-binding protein